LIEELREPRLAVVIQAWKHDHQTAPGPQFACSQRENVSQSRAAWCSNTA
jgi:hypothetical protein